MPVRQIDTSQKIYIKSLPSDSWVETGNLFCSSIIDSVGLRQRHSAAFKLITPDMKNVSAVPATQTIIDDAKKDMQYNADFTYGITDFVSGTTYSKGVWVKVTRDISSVETTLFVGVMWSCTWDLLSNTTLLINAIGIDGLLSQCGFIGSVHDTTSISGGGARYQFDRVKGVFNPDDLPNRSANKFTYQSNDLYVFDYSQITNKITPKYWEPQNVFEYILHRLKRQTHTGGKKLYHWWDYINGGQLTYQGTNPFTNQNRVSNYFIYDKSVWGVLVDLVETNGPFTLTIKYTDDEPKIEVIKLDG